jgi:AcrR family transcriptional regulator
VFVPEPRDAGVDAVGEELSARKRICLAARDLVLVHGYGAPTVEMVVERAGVSRAEFDLHFADLEDCCLQVYVENIVPFDEAVFGAFDRPGSWRDRLRAAAYALARFLRDRPEDVRFDVVEMSSAGPVPRVHRERQLQRLVDLIDLGRQELDDPETMSRAAAESVVGAIYALVVGELQAGRAQGAAAEDIVPDVMFVAVRPYLGHEAAMEEFSIPPPPEQPEGGD